MRKLKLQQVGSFAHKHPTVMLNWVVQLQSACPIKYYKVLWGNSEGAMNLTGTERANYDNYFTHCIFLCLLFILHIAVTPSPTLLPEFHMNMSDLSCSSAPPGPKPPRGHHILV